MSDMSRKGKGIGEVLFPVVEDGILNAVENHICTADAILLGALDMAERGQECATKSGSLAAAERFNGIIAFLELYQAGNSELIRMLYQAKESKAA
jgi:hypothetical protein